MGISAVLTEIPSVRMETPAYFIKIPGVLTGISAVLTGISVIFLEIFVAFTGAPGVLMGILTAIMSVSFVLALIPIPKKESGKLRVARFEVGLIVVVAP